jgi:hypothetical protein
LNLNNTRVFGELVYKVVNNNPELQKSSKREREKTERRRVNTGNKGITEEQEKNYLGLLME